MKWTWRAWFVFVPLVTLFTSTMCGLNLYFHRHFWAAFHGVFAVIGIGIFIWGFSVYRKHRRLRALIDWDRVPRSP